MAYMSLPRYLQCMRSRATLQAETPSISNKGQRDLCSQAFQAAGVQQVVLQPAVSEKFLQEFSSARPVHLPEMLFQSLLVAEKLTTSRSLVHKRKLKYFLGSLKTENVFL